MASEKRSKTVDMIELLEFMETQFKAAMKSTIKCYNTYDEVSGETYNDYEVIIGQLNLLNHMGFADYQEAADIKEYFYNLRLETLKTLENRVTENKED